MLPRLSPAVTNYSGCGMNPPLKSALALQCGRVALGGELANGRWCTHDRTCKPVSPAAQQPSCPASHFFGAQQRPEQTNSTGSEHHSSHSSRNPHAPHAPQQLPARSPPAPPKSRYAGLSLAKCLPEPFSFSPRCPARVYIRSLRRLPPIDSAPSSRFFLFLLAAAETASLCAPL